VAEDAGGCSLVTDFNLNQLQQQWQRMLAAVEISMGNTQRQTASGIIESSKGLDILTLAQRVHTHGV